MSQKEIDALAYSPDIYDPMVPEIALYQEKQKRLIERYNRLGTSLVATRRKQRLLPRIFGAIGEGSWVEAPFHSNFGAKHVFAGKGFYANSNLALVDDGKITIGDYVLLGPNVTLVTASHPISPTLRAKGLQYNKPVTIGNNVWMGAGVIVLPGVTIGDDVVIGAGSVVTRDIPSGVVAYGNPCRVARQVTPQDYVTYDHTREIPRAILDKYSY